MSREETGISPCCERCGWSVCRCSDVEIIAHHALVEIRCDHEAKQDMPVCNCALWSGGWHPTVQAAKEAWARHVLSELGRA
jgi:hypothetical protein